MGTSSAETRAAGTRAAGTRAAGTRAETHREVTALLRSAQSGDPSALHDVFARVYPELRALAGSRLRDASATVGPTELVHEVFLRLIGSRRLSLVDRRHFFACAARAMRMVVVDRMRRRAAEKRGGHARQITWTESLPGTGDDEASLLDLDRALGDLQEINPRAHEVVSLRFFAGLSAADTAELLGLSLRTVHREWQKARAFLHARLDRG